MRRRGGPTGATGAVATITLTVLVLVGVLVAVAQLRRPLHDESVPVQLGEVDIDPRVPFRCEQPAGREGQPRRGQAPPDPATLRLVSLAELVNCPETWDGRLVRFTGELVGAVLRREHGVWAQLNEIPSADAPLRGPTRPNASIGVLLPHDAVEEIRVVGGPRRRGDIVEVIARFARVDASSGEVAVLRAEQARVVEPGHALSAPDLRDRRIVAGALVPVALLLLVVERARERRV